MTTAKPYDAADYLDSPEIIAAYLTEAFESQDSTIIAKAIGAAARAQGMTDAVQKAGLSQEILSRPLDGDAELDLDTVLKVLKILGISLVAQTRAA